MTSTQATPQVLPYGSWPSPITVDLLTGGSVGLAQPVVDDGDNYWLEARPSEKGRVTLLRRHDDDVTEVTPAPFNVRNGVHEYGGGAYTVADGVVAFSHFVDGRVYLIEHDGRPRALTPDLPDRVLRYADLELDLPRRRLLAVREDHRGAGECVNTIVRIDLDPEPGRESAGDILVDGHDFVSSPRLSPDGHQLAFLTWEHPAMPWDSSVLWVGDADAEQVRALDGADGVSITDIGWLSDGRLGWCSDRSGFCNLVVDGQLAYPVDADCSIPAWIFGRRSWTELADGSIVIGRQDTAALTVVRLVAAGDDRPSGDSSLTGELAPVHRSQRPPTFTATDIAAVAGTDSLAADGDAVVMVAGFADRPEALVRLDLESGEQEVIAVSATETPAAEYFSKAEPVSWSTPDDAKSYGYYYRPVNPDAIAPAGELPPLMVLSHGGPTAAFTPALSLATQYWTSRGFAVLEVNYGGSTGHGRVYRDRLQGNWGVVDVDDCCSGAQYLVGEGLADPKRLVIRGGSAGGYTTLAALAFRTVFTAGVSKYGIGDLETMTTDTHKFESRYLDGLVGPYPEAKQTYLDRSPIHHIDRMDCALLLLQGADDKVVPPDQSTMMADAVRAKGNPVALRVYEGEGHGFRKAETVRDALESELFFHGKVFGFTPADSLPGLDIDNLA